MLLASEWLFGMLAHSEGTWETRARYYGQFWLRMFGIRKSHIVIWKRLKPHIYFSPSWCKAMSMRLGWFQIQAVDMAKMSTFQ